MVSPLIPNEIHRGFQVRFSLLQFDKLLNIDLI